MPATVGLLFGRRDQLAWLGLVWVRVRAPVRVRMGLGSGLALTLTLTLTLNPNPNPNPNLYQVPSTLRQPRRELLGRCERGITADTSAVVIMG